MAKPNPIRFSTKYQDDDSGQNYYGYRFYNPNPGRWLSRDPVGERGGVNIYSFVYSDPNDRIDVLGLFDGSSPITPGFNSVLPMTFQLPPTQIIQVPPPAPPIGIGVPNNQSVGSKKGDTTAGAAAGAIEMAGKLLLPALLEAERNQYIKEGIDDCIAQAKKNNSCCGCCMIKLYLLTGKFGENPSKRIVYNSSQYFNKPCFAAKADLASVSGPAWKPDYRKSEFNEVNWLIHHINGNPNLHDRIPIEDQTPDPYFRDICTK
jgi:RHS repeat-associated protein